MEGDLSTTDQQSMVSSFLEIAVGQTADTARQFLQATSWKLEDAIQLFYLGNDGGTAVPSFNPSEVENDVPLHDSIVRGPKEDIGDQNVRQVDGDDVRPPLPVKRDVLYDNSMPHSSPRMGGLPREAQRHPIDPFRNFEEEMRRPGVWEGDQGSSSVISRVRDNLASLYRQPFALIINGPFEKVNDDEEEGSKVCTYYKLDSIPVILIIDPITGQKMRFWLGMVQPENLLEDLLPFMDNCPSDHHVSLSHKRPRGSSQAPPSGVQANERNEEEVAFQRALAASMEGIKGTDEGIPKEVDKTISEKKETCLVKKPAYPPLPEEPRGDRNLLCRVGVRFPDGHRVQRNFLRTDPIQLLWSFCYSELKEADMRPFRLAQAIPGRTKSLEYDSGLTFEESDLANSMISVNWE